MMRRLLTLSLAALTLASCAGAPPRKFYRDNTTQQTYNEDAYACYRDAMTAGGSSYVGFGITERNLDWNMLVYCMQVKGYVYR